jgi:hypothetical protein
MKELKFKAWDKVKMKMFKPLAITFDTQSLSPFALSVPGRSWEPIHKFELLQYTGLSDKFGVEVFQEDLFEIDASLYRVVWSETHAGFILLDVRSSTTEDITRVSKEAILGNSFQNRELIE